MKVCVINIATNKYIDFIPQLWESINQYFLKDCQVESLLFTNHNFEPVTKNGKVVNIKHVPWPAPSLLRYRYISSEKEYLSNFDYIFYLDVDMRINDFICREILGELVAVKHPKFWNKDCFEFPYERNQQSNAYVQYGEGSMYYQNAFNGGRPEIYLQLCESLSEKINQDLSNGIVANVYDESYINRYLIDNHPEIELSPSYCYPEDISYSSQVAQFEPKIIALNKNHELMRF